MVNFSARPTAAMSTARLTTPVRPSHALEVTIILTSNVTCHGIIFITLIMYLCSFLHVWFSSNSKKLKLELLISCHTFLFQTAKLREIYRSVTTGCWFLFAKPAFYMSGVLLNNYSHLLLTEFLLNMLDTTEIQILFKMSIIMSTLSLISRPSQDVVSLRTSLQYTSFWPKFII